MKKLCFDTNFKDNFSNKLCLNLWTLVYLVVQFKFTTNFNLKTLNRQIITKINSPKIFNSIIDICTFKVYFKIQKK